MSSWRAVLAAIVVLLLAGCADGPATDPAPPAGPAATTLEPSLEFDAPRPVMAIPNTGHEVFLAVSPDGLTLLACAHGDFRAPAHMYASTDGGATFRELDAGPMVPAGDCDVALGPAGEWAFAGKTALGIAVAVTRDQGATWTVSHVAGPPLNGLADRQWISYAGPTLLLSYQPGTQEVGNVLVTRSTDGGATWSAPVEAFAPDAEGPAITAGRFLVGTDGVVRIPGLRGLGPVAGSPSRLVLAESLDGGATWGERNVRNVAATAYPTGAAIDAGGRITWAYVDETTLLVVTSADGKAWSEPAVIATGVAHERPWAGARPDGLVDILWLSDGSPFGTDLGVAITRIDPAAEQPVLAQARVSDVWFIEFASVAHDGTGRAHVAVVDAPRLMMVPPQATEALDGGRLMLTQEILPSA